MIQRSAQHHVPAAKRAPVPKQAQGDIAVFLARTNGLDPASTRLLREVLDDAERERLDRFLTESARQQFLLAHALLRVALSTRCGVPPSEWRFSRTAAGRPFVAGNKGRAVPYFSLSHTDSLVVCATSYTEWIGVDVERIDPELDLAALVPLVLTDAERESHDWVSSDDHLRLFYCYWTLKEALLKAVGLGLEVPLSTIAYDLSNCRSPQALSLPPIAGEPGHWRFMVLEPTRRHVLALASEFGRVSQSGISLNMLSIEEVLTLL